MNETETALQMAKEFSTRVREWADSCQIFLTVHDPATGITRFVTHGDGNWFAREGQVREWILQCEENSRAEAREED